MKKLLMVFLATLIGVALAGVITAGAGKTTIFNDTESVVYGLKVKFDQPVTISQSGKGFSKHSKETEKTILFSGGKLKPWGEFYFFWKPSDASIVSHQWVITPPTEKIKPPSPEKPEITITLPNDKDGDGLINNREASLGTDEDKRDTDGDGLSDYAEVTKYLTDPLKKDSDGDGESDFAWDERREYTETIRLVGKQIMPYDLDTMNNHYQDVRKIKEEDNWLTYEAIIYINAFDLLNPASYPREDLPEDFVEKYTEKTTLFNYSQEMVDKVQEIISGCSKDVEVVQALLNWKRQNIGRVYYNGKVGVPAIYRFIVREGEIKEWPKSVAAQSDWGESNSTLIKKNMLGNYMFKNRAHGSCCSAAIFLATMFRAAKVPTRATYEIPFFDRFEDKNAVESIENKKIRKWILDHPYDDHCAVQVLIGNRWIRINGDSISTSYGQHAWGTHVLLGAYKNFENTPLGLIPKTVAEALHWGKNPDNPYQTIQVSYQTPESTEKERAKSKKKMS